MKGIYTCYFKFRSPAGHDFYMLTFRCFMPDGRIVSKVLYTQKSFGNYPKWFKLMQAGVGTSVEGLVLYNSKLIDGDSDIRIIKKELEDGLSKS